MTTILDETIAAVGYAKVIVTLNPQAVSVAAAVGPKGAKSAMNAAATERALADYFIVPSQSQADMLAASLRTASGTRRRSRLPVPRVRVYPHLRLALGYVDQKGAAGLQARAEVAGLQKAPELSLIRPVRTATAKLGAEATWGIGRINADKLWAAGYKGKGVVVGHLDTGVDGSHPALTDAIAAFAEFDFAGNRVAGAQSHDSDEHGTHTAGTIAGRAGKKGAFGVAPEAQLASGLVIEGGQVIDRILAGMEWLAEQRVHILSMSLGIRGYTPAFQAVIDALRAANILPIIAVGNEGAGTSRSPGNYANVLSVGAMDESNRVADFSGSEEFMRDNNPLVPSLVAPGVGVLSSIPGGKFAEMDGSSMATPHIAGLAALLFGASPNATIDQVEQAILGSCRRPATMPAARANRGVPDAVKAFELLTGTKLTAAAAVSVAPARAKQVAAGVDSQAPRVAAARGGAKQPK